MLLVGAGGLRKGSQPSHCTAINNELFSACYDNGGFITVKPRRSTQLVCAAQAGGTQRASIGSPGFPRQLFPAATGRYTQQIPRKPPAAPRCLGDTFNLMEMQLRCCWQARARQRFSLSEVGCSGSRRRFSSVFDIHAHRQEVTETNRCVFVGSRPRLSPSSTHDWGIFGL